MFHLTVVTTLCRKHEGMSAKLLEYTVEKYNINMTRQEVQFVQDVINGTRNSKLAGLEAWMFQVSTWGTASTAWACLLKLVVSLCFMTACNSLWRPCSLYQATEIFLGEHIATVFQLPNMWFLGNIWPQHSW